MAPSHATGFSLRREEDDTEHAAGTAAASGHYGKSANAEKRSLEKEKRDVVMIDGERCNLSWLCIEKK